MLAQSNLPAAHAGEDQSSRAVFATREAYWMSVLVGLFGAVRTLANNYLQQELKDPKACVDSDHHRAVADVFHQISRGEALGLSFAGATQLAITGQADVELWAVNNEGFSTCSLSDLIAENDWLRPGDVVYKAETIRRHNLIEADFNTAAAPAVIGGEA